MNVDFKGFMNQVTDLSSMKLGLYQSKTKYVMEFSAYSLIAFCMPLFFPHQQMFLGVAVNSMLICGALYISGKRLIPLIVLPSIGVLSQGLLFGSLSVYLLYMLPFIWIGNAILVFGIKAVFLEKRKHFVSGIVYAGAFKSVFLFCCAFGLYSLGLVPVMFLAAFGGMQFATAFCAGMIMWPVNSLRMKSSKK